MTRRTLLLLLALLLLPGVAEAASVSFRLHLDRPRLEGPAEVVAGHGVLDLGPAVRASEGLSLRWESASGYLVTRTWTMRGPSDDLGVYDPDERARNDSLRLGAGTLGNLSCAEGCRAILFVEDERGNVSLAGHASGGFRWLPEERTWFSAWEAPGHPDSFFLKADAGWLVASGHGEATRLLDARASASGRVGLFLANVTAEVHEEGRVEQLDTVSRTRTAHGPLGVRTGRVGEIPFVVLHLEGASLETPEGTRAELLAPAARVSWSGTLDAVAAWGTLVVDGEPREARGERFRLEGAASGPFSLTAADALPLPPQPQGERPVRGQGEGEATHVHLGSARLVHEPGPSLALASGLTLAAVLLLAWVVVKFGGLTALYMRVDAASVLRNANRQRMMAALREQPGQSVADLVRATGIAQVVVRHHLRMLLAHQLVAARAAGGRRLFFAAGEARAAALHLTLKTEARRAVAVAIASSPRGLSQREISLLAGLQQRLVSYHLGLLQREGLVEARGSMPRRYLAGERLAAFLAHEDGAS